MENIGFTILVAFLGMTIVFTFLGILYVIMSLLKLNMQKIISRENRYSLLKSIPEHKPAKNIHQFKDVQYKDIQWLTAALIAYLEVESQTETPTAIPWKHNNIHDKETWLIINRIKGNGLI